VLQEYLRSVLDQFADSAFVVGVAPEIALVLEIGSPANSLPSHRSESDFLPAGEAYCHHGRDDREHERHRSRFGSDLFGQATLSAVDYLSAPRPLFELPGRHPLERCRS
jgi:hypothetical protein